MSEPPVQPKMQVRRPHGNTMRKWLWKDVLDNVGHYGSRLMPLHAIGSVVGVFAVCTLIDLVRIRVLEKPFFRLWDKIAGMYSKGRTELREQSRGAERRE